MLISKFVQYKIDI